VPEIFVIESFQINSGNKMISTSTVSIKRDDKIITEAATGDGPVDAAFNAIERATGVSVELVHYRIQAVTEGKDALGEVTVKISSNENVYMGKGVSTDIIEASVKAYLNAINRSISEVGESSIIS